MYFNFCRVIINENSFHIDNLNYKLVTRTLSKKEKEMILELPYIYGDKLFFTSLELINTKEYIILKGDKILIHYISHFNRENDIKFCYEEDLETVEKGIFFKKDIKAINFLTNYDPEPFLINFEYKPIEYKLINCSIKIVEY
jgi:hypothetical protein